MAFPTVNGRGPRRGGCGYGGVVVQGSFDPAGQFVAAEVLAKHDETYMPPEVAKALKESGRWHETQGKGTQAAQ